jgi:hypothetical protein
VLTGRDHAQDASPAGLNPRRRRQRSLNGDATRTAATLHDLLVLRLAELHKEYNKEVQVPGVLAKACSAIRGHQTGQSRDKTRLLMSALGRSYSFDAFKAKGKEGALAQLNNIQLQKWRREYEREQLVKQRQAEQAAEEQQQEGAIKAAAAASERSKQDNVLPEVPRDAKRRRSGPSGTAVPAKGAEEEAAEEAATVQGNWKLSSFFSRKT